MTAFLAALWLLVGPFVTVVPLDEDAALKPRGIYVNEYRQMHVLDDNGAESVTLADGSVRSTRLVNAALGCNEPSPGEIVYYRRSEGMHRADIKRESPSMPFRERIQRAHERHVETEVHELAHAYDCLDDGKLNGSPGHHDYVSDDPYCRSNDSERYACAVAETGRLK